MYKYTVIWGNIGDDSGKRLDHVTVSEPTQKAIVDAAFACFFDDMAMAGIDLTAEEKDEYRHGGYDGYAVFDGHIYDAPGVGFW